MLPETSIVYTKQHLIILIYHTEHLREATTKKGEGNKEAGWRGSPIPWCAHQGTPRMYSGSQQRVRVRRGAESTPQALPGYFTF